MHHILNTQAQKASWKEWRCCQALTLVMNKVISAGVPKLLGAQQSSSIQEELECSNLSSPAFLDSDPTVCLAFLGLHSKPLTTKGQKGD